jgi:transposase-like protein
MAAKYNKEFKEQAVQELLNRGQGVTIADTVTLPHRPLLVQMN